VTDSCDLVSQCDPIAPADAAGAPLSAAAGAHGPTEGVATV